MAGMGLMRRPDSVAAREDDFPDTLGLDLTGDLFSSEQSVSLDTVPDGSFVDDLPAHAEEPKPPSADPPAHWQDGVRERLLFSASINQNVKCSDEAEVQSLLGKTFADCFDATTPSDTMSLAEMIGQIEAKSNYTIEMIFRVQNRIRYKMHQTFKEAHGLAEIPERLVFHGTSYSTAKMISHEGFRGAASTRSAYGTGIYCTDSKWLALLYADPVRMQDDDKFIENVQSLIVADMIQGNSTRLGESGMLDFGYDDQGYEIMTSANTEGSILCVKYEDQLLPRYRIAVRYMGDRALTQEVDKFVNLWHSDIFSSFVKPARVVFQSDGKGPANQAFPPKIARIMAIAAAGGSAAVHNTAPKVEVLQMHHGWKLGDRVILCKPLADYRFVKDRPGEIAFIEKVNSSVFIYIKVDDIVDSNGTVLLTFQKQIGEVNDKGNRRPVQDPGGPNLVLCTRLAQFRMDPASLKRASKSTASAGHGDKGKTPATAPETGSPAKRRRIQKETGNAGEGSSEKKD